MSSRTKSNMNECDANVLVRSLTVVTANTKPSIISNITAASDANSLTPLPCSSPVTIGQPQPSLQSTVNAF